MVAENSHCPYGLWITGKPTTLILRSNSVQCVEQNGRADTERVSKFDDVKQ
jgi:hypothetical protein